MGMGLKRQVKEEMMWTSVLNFHTLQAPGNSIRQAENPGTSGILPTATGPFIRPPSVNLERGQKRMDAGLFNQSQETNSGSDQFTPLGRVRVKPAAELLELLKLSVTTTCWEGTALR